MLIIGLLSVQWTAGERRFDNPPMEVDLIAETAATSSAPVISETPPAARLGEENAVDIAAPEPMPAPPEPEPVVRPTPAPAPKQVSRPTPAPPKKTPPAAKKAPPKAAPKSAPSKSATARPTGRLDGITDGLGREQTKSPSKGAPAAKTAAEVRRSAQLAVDREIRPYWQRNAPLGYEVELLRLTLEIRLRADGTVIDVKQVGELGGTTESNAPQQKRFVEQARKSVVQAAPFEISAEGYDGVIVIRQPFAAVRR
ncbi:hypothetical protein [Sphingopyxis macrogoltabida]|uniref:hypothetical protein n=1 Tax=Sphingopyxis macrogoltabida TaxID=33050 RepID=UPI001913C3B5|nr:hypothetical protein [Sphingopyxis macrogoltabida]